MAQRYLIHPGLLCHDVHKRREGGGVWLRVHASYIGRERLHSTPAGAICVIPFPPSPPQKNSPPCWHCRSRPPSPPHRPVGSSQQRAGGIHCCCCCYSPCSLLLAPCCLGGVCVCVLGSNRACLIRVSRGGFVCCANCGGGYFAFDPSIKEKDAFGPSKSI
jgi:hypothetical protein